MKKMIFNNIEIPEANYDKIVAGLVCACPVIKPLSTCIIAKCRKGNFEKNTQELLKDANVKLKKKLIRSHLSCFERRLPVFLKLLSVPHENFIASVKLTKRERQILGMIIKCMKNTQISADLKISQFTVENHRKNIRKKLNAHSTADLINKGWMILCFETAKQK